MTEVQESTAAWYTLRDPESGELNHAKVAALSAGGLAVAAAALLIFKRKRGEAPTLDRFMADSEMVSRMDTYLYLEADSGLAKFARGLKLGAPQMSETEWLSWFKRHNWEPTNVTWNFIQGRDSRCMETLARFCASPTPDLNRMLDMYDRLLVSLRSEMLKTYPAGILEQAARVVLTHTEQGMQIWPWHVTF